MAWEAYPVCPNSQDKLIIPNASFALPCHLVIFRVGQNHIYTVYIRYFWQGKHQIYGHIRCIYTVLANPSYCNAHNTPRGGQKHLRYAVTYHLYGIHRVCMVLANPNQDTLYTPTAMRLFSLSGLQLMQ